ncbi:1-aminocyclopropane-1-carboxylate oxidase-like protein, partial [Trifolium pratense]
MGTNDTGKPNLDSILSERKAFDETKAGVKGLVDEGLKKIPSFFHHQPDKYQKANNPSHVIPVIDLVDIDNKDPSIHQGIVDKIKEACETWGFFQITNHGIPLSVLEELKDGVKSSPALNWRDTFICYLAPDTHKPEDFPVVCRDILPGYGKYMMDLGTLLFELLSEAL